MGTSAKNGNIAVLIDGENISVKYIKFIFDELSNYPQHVTYKRIYGDLTDVRLNSWKKVLHDYAITPVQQFSYTVGKNSSDSALIIDAMDILYSGNVSSFCIVSSDSDFTRLASRLRESGMHVIGMGERKTPKSFISACDTFKYLEVISAPPAEETEAAGDELANLIPVLEKVVEENCDESGYIFLGMVGSLLQKKLPEFDVRNYGYKSLTKLIKATGRFNIDERKKKGEAPLIYITLKQR
jgi:uncharacterized LabA/DUF88 family protein